jgi:hypothetical protein
MRLKCYARLGSTRVTIILGAPVGPLKTAPAQIGRFLRELSLLFFMPFEQGLNRLFRNHIHGIDHEPCMHSDCSRYPTQLEAGMHARRLMPRSILVVRALELL